MYVVLTAAIAGVFPATTAMGQQIPCPDDDQAGLICIDEHPREVAKFHHLVELFEQGETLLNSWRTSWPQNPPALQQRIATWKQRSTKYLQFVDNDWPPPGVAYVSHNEEDSEYIDAVETRIHYLQFAADSSFARCRDAVVLYMRASKYATGDVKYSADFQTATSTDSQAMGFAARAVAARRNCAAPLTAKGQVVHATHFAPQKVATSVSPIPGDGPAARQTLTSPAGVQLTLDIAMVPEGGTTTVGSIAKGDGTLYVIARDGMHSFSRDASGSVSLDLVFIALDSTITGVARLEPGADQHVTGFGAYVLVLPSGKAALDGFAANQRVVGLP